MRDNSDTEDSIKVNAQTGLQPIYTFIMRSGYAMILKKLRGIFMDSAAIRTPSIAFGVDENLKARLKEIGRVSFNAVREDVENYELPIEDSEDLPRTREVSKSIKKLLNRLINSRIVTSPLTLDIYNNFIDAYETDPDFEPQGEILETLALTYSCYTHAYLTDISSKLEFWSETSELSQQKHLEYFQLLLDWRLKRSSKTSFVDRVYLFLSLTNFAYGINILDLVDDYKDNIDLYIQNISNILVENAVSNLKIPPDFEKSNAANADSFKAKYGYIEKNILDCEIEEQGLIRLSVEDYQALTESLPTNTSDEKLTADISWYESIMNNN